MFAELLRRQREAAGLTQAELAARAGLGERTVSNLERSAEFYKQCFGWEIRKRGDGATAFDDGVGQVSGAWVLGRPPAAQPGLVVYIMVDSVANTIDKVVAAGGEIVQPVGADAPEITARFRDPAGNIFGLFEEH